MASEPAILYTSLDYAESYNRAVDSVARERRYLATTQGFPLEGSRWYVNHMVEHHLPQYFLVDEGRVGGWCDITPRDIPEFAHVGVLGMGLLPEYRGRGYGKALLLRALDHARTVSSLEKVELVVFESNQTALALYRHLGFEVEGRRVNARKIDGTYDHEVEMGLFLGPLP